MNDPAHLLLLDIGNTNSKIGLASGGTFIASYVIPTKTCDTPDIWGFRVLEICRLHDVDPNTVSAWLASSVVPPVNAQVRMAAQRYCDCPVRFVPDDLPLTLENRYARPEEVGSDRLVTAYAARQMFDTSGIIVIDFGTATTLDCVQDNAYLGGLICPGVQSSARALGTQTAKLPNVSLELNSLELQIGVSTSTSLNNGFVHGFAALVGGLCTSLQKQLKGQVTVVATGGFAQTIQPVCPCIDHIRPDLLLRGLLMAHAAV